MQMTLSSHVKTQCCTQHPSFKTVAVKGAVVKHISCSSAGPSSLCPVQGLFDNSMALTIHLFSEDSQVKSYDR